jgi:hypothetical protein
MKEDKNPENDINNKEKKLVEGIDFCFENNLMVLTEHFLLKRGYCCENNCRNCPYKNKIQ